MAVNIEALKDILRINREQKSVEEEELENNLCPYDDWPLKTNSKGYRSCEICGRIFSGE